MADIFIKNGIVVTQNPDREIIEDGAVAISNDVIEEVGETNTLTNEYEAQRTIDADGCVVIPGLINTHTHVNERLQRGTFSENRGLYDWLFNVYWPGITAMSDDDYELAATIYCIEAIQSGVTTFVENDVETQWGDLSPAETKLDVYDRSGIRGIYAAGIMDKPPTEELLEYKEKLEARNPDAEHIPADYYHVDTETGLSGLEDLMETHHGTADGRISIWPAPAILVAVTTENLQRSYELAEEYDVMTTTHVSEAEIQDYGPGVSNIEYLRNIGYLGERSLLGHCVQIDEDDVRLLARTDTRVAHNYMANMRLATGYAPIVTMLDSGVTVGLGTDDSSLNDTINPLSDLRAAAAGHKGHHRTPEVFQTQTAFDMATIQAARAIGRDSDLGSIESGKQADLAIINLDYPHLTPVRDPVFTLVHSVQGFETETVICNGDIVMEDRELESFDVAVQDVMDDVSTRGLELAKEAGIE